MKTKLPGRVNCPLPLINPSTFLTAGAWQNVFEFILNMLRANTRSKKLSHNIEVTFRDFYFAKIMEKFNFPKAARSMRKFGKVKSGVHENQDRDDEYDATVNGHGLRFRMYEYHSAICLSVGGSVETDGFFVKEGKFQHQPVVWKTDMETFLKFAQLIEQTFMHLGETWVARGFMDVRCGRATVSVGIFHERLPTDELHWKKGVRNDTARQLLDGIGVVPLPRCEIRFE